MRRQHTDISVDWQYANIQILCYAQAITHCRVCASSIDDVSDTIIWFWSCSSVYDPEHNVDTLKTYVLAKYGMAA